MRKESNMKERSFSVLNPVMVEKPFDVIDGDSYGCDPRKSMVMINNDCQLGRFRKPWETSREGLSKLG